MKRRVSVSIPAPNPHPHPQMIQHPAAHYASARGCGATGAAAVPAQGAGASTYAHSRHSSSWVRRREKFLRGRAGDVGWHGEPVKGAEKGLVCAVEWLGTGAGRLGLNSRVRVGPGEGCVSCWPPRAACVRGRAGGGRGSTATRRPAVAAASRCFTLPGSGGGAAGGLQAGGNRAGPGIAGGHALPLLPHHVSSVASRPGGLRPARGPWPASCVQAAHRVRPRLPDHFLARIPSESHQSPLRGRRPQRSR